MDLAASKLDPTLSFAAVNGAKDFSDRMILKMGKQACIYNVETKKQEYFDRPKNYTDISHFATSSNCRFISIVIEKVYASSKVFAVVGRFGLVIIYERSDDKHDP